jgi:hypothetical protein
MISFDLLIVLQAQYLFSYQAIATAVKNKYAWTTSITDQVNNHAEHEIVIL